MFFEIITDPYGKAGSTGSIYSFKKFDLEFPTYDVACDVYFHNNLLILYPDYSENIVTGDFKKFYFKAIFHTRMCHFREYKSEITG